MSARHNCPAHKAFRAAITKSAQEPTLSALEPTLLILGLQSSPAGSHSWQLAGSVVPPTPHAQDSLTYPPHLTTLASVHAFPQACMCPTRGGASRWRSCPPLLPDPSQPFLHLPVCWPEPNTSPPSHPSRKGGPSRRPLIARCA